MTATPVVMIDVVGLTPDLLQHMPRLRALEPYVPYMDEGAQFLCALLHGLHDPLEEALVRLRQADAHRPCSVVSSAAAARLSAARRPAPYASLSPASISSRT